MKRSALFVVVSALTFGFALLTANAAEVRTAPTAFTAPGGALQPYGPARLTPAKQAQRTRARRARGFAHPDVVSARRHRQLAARAASRERRARRLAQRHMQLSRAVGAGEAVRIRSLARRQLVAAQRFAETRRYHLAGAATALSAPVAATCAAPPAMSPYSQYTLPAWSDIAGWASSEVYYGTIQLADVTGDGADEVLARGPDGVNLSQLQTATSTFSTLPLGPPLSDANGWNQPQFALSIRAGDIDGDQDAEVVGLDGAGQVATWVGDAEAGTWTQLAASSSPAWDSAGTDWSNPAFYETFQLVDLDGNGDEELVTLAASGVIAADFNDQTGTWTALPPGPGLSQANGWSYPQYGGTMQIADIDGQPGAELVVLNATTPVPYVFTYSFNPATQSWTALNANLAWTAAAQGATDWTNPAYYTTFRFANLVGSANSGPEIVARSADGVLAAEWSSAETAWVPIPTSAILPDSAGWNLPQYYETMTIADLEGDGLDEIVIAGQSQLQVYSYSAATPASPWAASSSQPLVPSAWAEQASYGTFRAGDVDGDGADEVVFRDPYGLRTLAFVDGQLVSNIAPFPVFAGEECSAYNAIVQANSAVLGAAGLSDIRAAYGSGTVDLADLVVPSRSPNRSIPAPAYAAVAAQIRTELGAAIAVDTWHNGTNGMSTVIEQGFTPQVGSIGRVTSYFVPKPSQGVAGFILPFIQGIVEAIGTAAEPEGSIVSEEVATGINSVLGSAWNGLSGSGQTTFQLNETEAQLQAQVSVMQQQAINGNSTNASLIPREYGLMIALADAPLPAGTEPWQEMWRASDVYFWQQFGNAFWNIEYCEDYYGPIAQLPCNADMWEPPSGAGYGSPGDDSGVGYWVGDADDWPASFVTSPSGSGYPPAWTVLFGTPSAACTPPFSATTAYTSACLLGIPQSEFYLSQAGWSMPTKQVTG